MNQIEIEDFRYIMSKISLSELEGKKILVTGASGFIASYIIKFLSYCNATIFCNPVKVVALCRNEQKLRSKLEHYSFNNIDIVEQDVTRQIFIEKVDYIIHAASISSTSLFDRKPVDVAVANSVGTYQVLEYARRTEIAGLLFFSSGAVYGEIPEHVTSVGETDSFYLNFSDTHNCYTESKRFAEQLLLDYNKQYNIPVKIVRISHTYGPGIDLKDGHVYSDFINFILKEEDLILKSDGSAIRPFCYISDAVIAFFTILLEKSCETIFNMANIDNYTSVYNLALLLTQNIKTDKKLKVICKNKTEIKKTEFPIMSIDNLKKLGWKPTVDIIEGFRRTISYYKTKEADE